MDQLEPCPFCGGLHISIDDEYYPHRQFWYRCDDCDTIGPAGSTLKAAAEAWNMRVKEDDNIAGKRK